MSAEDTFRELLESAPDAMVLVDGDGRMVQINAQAETLFGYTRDELVGRPVELLIPERFQHAHPHHLAAYVAAPRVRALSSALHLYGRCKDGSELPIEISLWPVHTAKGVLVASAIRDITARKRLEDQTQEASRLKTELLANMSHELRSPLNAIIGFSELMHDGRVGPVAAEHHEYLGDILTSARHLLQLIDGVLELAKVESGRLELRPQAVDVARLVAEIHDVVRGVASAKRLRIDIAIDGVTTVVADPARLKQVLYNYLSNAIKFTPEGGAVTIRIGPAELAHEFRIEIEDTGIGIAAADLAKLFAGFQQLDASTGKRYQGTGLGLALTKRIVEGHGGRVGVASTPGQGSVFTAILPRATRADGGGDGA